MKEKRTEKKKKEDSRNKQVASNLSWQPRSFFALTKRSNAIAEMENRKKNRLPERAPEATEFVSKKAK